MSTRLQPPKKVRLACQRCRSRRIKCDGEVPACTNCNKAGEICLDVDSQNPAVLIPRNFATAAQARIQWLESIIRERVPDVDLDAGPKVDAAPDQRIAPAAGERESESSGVASVSQEFPAPQRQSSKRRADSDATSQSHDEFPGQAHFIAVNLGMLSLNSESNQKHYLGSSSGRLFANLIGVSPSSEGSTPMGLTDGDDEDPSPGWPAMSVGQDPLRQHYRSLHQILRRELPRKQDALLLLQSYIYWMHPDYPVLDPASLFAGLDALYSTFECSLEDDPFSLGWPSCARPFRWNGRLVTPQDPDSGAVAMPVVAFITFMVLNISSTVRVRSRSYDHAPDKFYRAALQFSQDCFTQITLPSIQALVSLIIHSMLTPAEINLWTLLHVALAHCVELGIHREDEESPEDVNDQVHRQIQRSMFYTIYSLDRSIAAIQGRPLGFRDETFDVKMPEAHSNAMEVPPLLLHPGFSVAVVRYSTCQFQLDMITSDIKLHLYHLPGASTLFHLSDQPAAEQRRIKNSLDEWLTQMPSMDDNDLLGIDKRQRRVWLCKLKTRYHTAMVLLFQPSQTIRNPNAAQLSACFKHACSILDNYQLLHDMQGLHYGWRAVQNIFAAGATVVYCFWMSASVRQGAIAVDLTRTLRACTSLLALGGEWWPSARRGQRSFGSVVDLTIQRLFSEQRPSKMPRLAAPATANADHVHEVNHGASSTQSSQDASVFSAGIMAESDAVFPPVSEVGGLETVPWSQMQDFHETWDGLPPETEFPDATEFGPEVESFLADFGRSKFSWTFPLDDSGGRSDPNHVPGLHF